MKIIEKTKQFLSEVKIEMKRVSWPHKKETMQSTVVVIVMIFLIAAFLGIVDYGLLNVVGKFIK